MVKTATSITQSKKLLNAGIDISTADMVYSKHSADGDLEEYALYYNNEGLIDEDEIPAWSISALWDIMNDYKSQFTPPPIRGIKSDELLDAMVQSILNYKKRR